MKKLGAALAALLLSSTAQAGWEERPTPKTAGKVELTALAADKGGAPVLAWTEQHGQPETGSRQVHAARWTGQGWQALGGVVNEDPTFNAAQLMARTDRAGNVWLGWAEDAGIAHVDSWIMSRWDGGRWAIQAAPVRRNLSDAGRSRSFDVLPSGIPALAWTDIHVPGAWAAAIRPLSWDGQTWQPEGVLNHLKFAGFDPDIRVQSGGLRTVTLLEGDYATMNVIVQREVKTNKWQRLGQPLNRAPGSFAADPKLALSPWGQEIVAWIEAPPNRADTLYVSRWQGDHWEKLGGGISSGQQAAEAAALAITPQGVRVAWLEAGQLHAAEWKSGRWSPLPLPSMKNATGPSLSPDGQYLSVSDGGKLRVWAWDD